MINLTHNNSYQRIKHTIPAQSVYTVDFNGNNPNYYRLNNMSNTILYCATNSYPKADLYDFKAGPKAVGNFTEPTTRNKVHIYNPSTEDADIILVTWAGEFDPSFMAISEITLNNEGEIKTDGAIKSFETSLPAGSNNIGSVDINNMDYYFKLNGYPIVTHILDSKTALNSAKNLLTEIKDRDYTENLTDIKSAIENISITGGSGSSGSSLPEVVYLKLFVFNEYDGMEYSGHGQTPEEYITINGWNNLNVDGYIDGGISLFDKAVIKYNDLLDYNYGPISVIGTNIEEPTGEIAFSNMDGNQIIPIKVWNNNYHNLTDVIPNLQYFEGDNLINPFEHKVVILTLYRKDVIMPVPEERPVIKTDVKYIPVTLGKLFDKTIKLSDYGLTGYRVGKIIGVNDKNVTDDVFVTIKTWGILNGTPSVTDEFVHWYDFNNVDDSQKYTDKLHIQCDADTSGAIIFEVYK